MAALRERLPDQREKLALDLAKLNATIQAIESDVKTKVFETRVFDWLGEIDAYKQELSALAEASKRVSGMDAAADKDWGDLHLELNNFGRKLKGLTKRYKQEVVAPLSPESAPLPAPTVGQALARGKVSELMPVAPPEAAVFAESVVRPAGAQTSVGPEKEAVEAGGKTRAEAITEQLWPDPTEARQARLEEKRNVFIGLKRKTAKSRGFIPRVGRLFRRRLPASGESALAQARAEYEWARAEYVGADVARALDERVKLIDAEVAEKIKNEAGSGNVLRYIIDGYAKLGRMNLGATEWGKKRLEKEGWLGKAFLRLASVRSAVNLGLVGGAGVIAGAGAAAGLTASGILGLRRALSAIGAGGLTYDALKARAIAQEEDKGFLKELPEEELAGLETEELMRKKQAIEARNLLDAKTDEQSAYRNLSVMIDIELKKRADSDPEKVATEQKATALREFLAEADILADNEVLKIYQKKAGRQKAIGVAVGAAVATGAVGTLFKKLGVTDLFRESYEYWREKIGGGETAAFSLAEPEVAASPSVEAAGGKPEEYVSAETGREQFVAQNYDALVRKGEGVTHVLQRDLRVHPEHLESFRHIKGVEKIIAAHQGNLSDITPKELNRAAWLIENDKVKGFGQELLIKGPADSVAVVFDEEAGRYKIGTLDESDVMEKVYTRIEAVVEKHPSSAVEFGEIKSGEDKIVDEAVKSMEARSDGMLAAEKPGLRFPTAEEMAKLKFSPDAARELAAIAAPPVESKNIIVPVESLPEGAVVKNKEEIFGTRPREIEPTVGRATETVPSVTVSETSAPMEAPPPALQNEVLENYEKHYIKAVNELISPLEGGAGPFKHISALPLSGDKSAGAKEFLIKVYRELNTAQVFDMSNTDLAAKLLPGSGVSEAELTRAVKDDVISRLSDKESYLLFEERSGGSKFAVLEGGSHAMRVEDPGDATRDYFIYNDEYLFTVDSAGNPIAQKEGVAYAVNYDFEATPPKIWIGEIQR